MADYIYLLEHRLSPAQRTAVRTVAELVRSKGLTLFLVGGAVRDLTTGSPVRDLDLAVQGNVLKLRKDLERAGAIISGEYTPLESLYLRFAGGVRLELSSTMSVTWPKPGKPVAKAAGIQDDLRRRDFTANAMALSLNEGSYGLLMDPLNGIADIENRELRLISNYGFIEEPVRMIRAVRLMARLGWQMEERTAARYKTGQEENYIEVLSDFHRGYETEEIFHEEDPLRVLRRLQAEGWMTHLAPFLTEDKMNVAELERLRETQTRLQMQSIQPDAAASSFPLLTAKLTADQIATLKASFPRKGFVAEIDGLDAEVKALNVLMTGKQTARASETWKLLHQSAPEVVLALAYGSRSAVVQAKFKSFETEWPQARQRIPYQLMQEMRIVPELPGYADLVDKLFFELMDGDLTTPEAMRAYLEPYSPPAPPPPVSLRKARAPKKEAKAVKARARKPADEDEDISVIASPAADVVAATPAASEVVGEPAALPVKPAAVVKPAAAKTVPVKTPAVKAAPAKIVEAPKAESTAKSPAKKAVVEKPVVPGKTSTKAAKPVPAKVSAKAVPAKSIAPKKAAKPAKSAPAKAVAKGKPVAVKAAPAKKIAAKAPIKNVAKKASAVKGRAVAPAVKSPAKRRALPVAKKAVPAKKSPPVKKAVSAKKAAPAKKTARRR